MVEVCRRPTACIVASAALPRKVIGGLITGVTRDAVGLPGVIKRACVPISGVVTGAALACEVIGGLVFGMARRTIRQAGMIKRRTSPR
jgi:hypothetical protein